MSIAQEALGPLADVRASWSSDWIWGCPLIVITVILHALGLGWLGERAVTVHNNFKKHAHPTISSAAVIGAATLLATILHALEATIWALTFIFLGALPDARSAMLYSLGAMTTYGHQSVYLERSWRLLGTIEALNGWLLFGLSTAFLFWLMQEISPKKSRGST